MSTAAFPAPKVIALHLRRLKNTARFEHTIRQEELQELLSLQALLKEAADNHEKLYNYIKTAIQSGARVEPGLHTAEVVRNGRRAYRVAAMQVFRLVVK